MQQGFLNYSIILFAAPITKYCSNYRFTSQRYKHLFTLICREDVLIPTELVGKFLLTTDINAAKGRVLGLKEVYEIT